MQKPDCFSPWATLDARRSTHFSLALSSPLLKITNGISDAENAAATGAIAAEEKMAQISTLLAEVDINNIRLLLAVNVKREVIHSS